VNPVRRRPEVISDIAETYAWIGERDVDAAERFAAAVEKTFERIRRNPRIGWKRTWTSRALAGMRSWRVEGFTEFPVFYREDAAGVEIFGVLRGSRRFEQDLIRR
jgi:toxin ParE1/3/4